MVNYFYVLVMFLDVIISQIGLFMFNEPAFIALWQGCNRIGTVAAFLNTNLRHKSLLHCIDIAEVKLLILGKDSVLLEVCCRLACEFTSCATTKHCICVFSFVFAEAARSLNFRPIAVLQTPHSIELDSVSLVSSFCRNIFILSIGIPFGIGM